jgi:hypothetical protein
MPMILIGPGGRPADSGPSGRRLATACRLVVYTAVLFASFHANALGVRSGLLWYQTEPRSGYQGMDSALVLARLRVTADGGHPLHPLADERTPDRVEPYLSQFGLQGVALSGLMCGLDAPPGPFARAAAAGFALLTALTLAAFLAAVSRDLGPTTADVAAALTAAAPVFVQFAPSLYWVTFLLLAPFVATWVLYPWASGSRRRKVTFLALLGLLVTAKALCGYEYITTTVLAPLAAVWFHQHRAAVPLRSRARWAVGVVGIGLAGFGAALGLHAAQLWVVLGTDPVATITGRARFQTAADGGRQHLVRTFERTWLDALPDRVAYPANCFADYFLQPAVSAPAVWTRGPAELSLGWAVLGVCGCATAAVAIRRRDTRTTTALFGAAALGLGAAVSWQVTAVTHMCVHEHLNLIVFGMAFLPTAAVLCGWGVAAGADRVRCGRVIGPGLLGLLAATAAVTAVRADARSAAEPGEQVRAERAVGEYLRTGEKCHPRGVTGSVYRFATEYQLHYDERVEIGRTDMTEPLDRRDPVFVLIGWVVDYECVERLPAARVVVVVDGRVVPAAVVRYGQAHWDRQFGRRVPVGFAAVVAQADVPPGAAVRVFAVSAADPNRMWELAVPPVR